MKPGSTTTSRKPRKRARNGAIPPHQNRKNSPHNHLRERMNEGQIWSTTCPEGTLWPVQRMHISERINCVLPSSPNEVEIWVHVFCSNMIMLGPILPVQLLQQSKICPSSVFYIRRTRQISPPVTFVSLDLSKRRWEESLSGPTKRCSRRCTSDCVLSQKNFFLEVSMHYRRAGSLVWNAMETTSKKWSHCVPFVFSKLWDKNI